MAFAIFFDRQDWTPLAAEVTRDDIPPGDKGFAQSCWNNGLSDWSSAPDAPEPWQSVNGIDPIADPANALKIVVIDGKHQGQTITRLQFCDFLRRCSTLSGPSAYYLDNLADAIMPNFEGITTFSKEPWP